MDADLQTGVTSTSQGRPRFDADARRQQILGQPFQSEHSRALARHWLDIAGDRIMPAKSDLRPEELVRTLPNLLIYEYVSPEEIRFRLYGTALRAAYRRDLTGENYLDLTPPGERKETSERLFTLINFPCAAFSRLMAPAGKEVMGTYEAVGFPLTDDKGKPGFAIYASDLIQRGLAPCDRDPQKIHNLAPMFLDIGNGLPD